MRDIRMHVRSLPLALLAVIFTSGLVLFALAAEENEDDTCESPRNHPQDKSLLLYQFDTITSTQDEARRIAEEGWGDGSGSNPRSFVVTAREQTKGRGTNGRTWICQRGNVFVTIGIRLEDWMSTKIPLTLLPLKIGTLVAERVQSLLDECVQGGDDNGKIQAPLVTVKWPNDVLVDERKISGILIESSSNGWFLVGIGVNLVFAPEVEQSGPDRGRPATSIADFCPESKKSFISGKIAEQFGSDLGYELCNFLLQGSTRDEVLGGWKQWIDWDMELVMRDTPGQERVRMIDVLPDGRVQVQNIEDGRVRTLVSDYFL